MIDIGSREETLVRAPALPAQPMPGGRLRQGGKAPLRALKIELVEGA